MKYERIEVTVADGSAWLERLSPRQMIALGDRLWSEKRKRLIQDMKDAEIESCDRIKALQDHDRKRGLMSEIISHAITSHGAIEIIGEAAKMPNSENADALPDCFEGTAEDAMRIALELVGAQVSLDDDTETNPKKK